MKAICRVSKVKGAGSMAGKSSHNYRLAEVPNADPALRHLNQEYVNAQFDLEPAIEARIQKAQISRVRKDAVKAMEFILAASPDLFPRDEAGRIVNDYRNSSWVRANLAFMQLTYGPNLVAFTLHQDEKTPHIHAVVVPITADGRLSAKDLFNPKTLRQLQTDYAGAMAPFGLERGIKGSRTRHIAMKQLYGVQETQALTLDTTIHTAAIEPPTIEKPSPLDLLNLDRWHRQQQAKLNAEFIERMHQVEKAALQARNVAVANVKAQSDKKVLEGRLLRSEGLKQAHYETIQDLTKKLASTNKSLDSIAVQLDQGRVINAEWSQKRAQMVRERVLPQFETEVLAILRQPVQHENDSVDLLDKGGYKIISRNGLPHLRQVASGVEVEMTHFKRVNQVWQLATMASVEPNHPAPAQVPATPKGKEELKFQPTPPKIKPRGPRF